MNIFNRFSVKVFSLVAAVLMASSLISFCHANTQAIAPHMSVELISDHTQIAVNSRFRMGVNFVPEAGWHIYWLNPGDTGLAPTVAWDSNNKGVNFTDIQWPFPELIKVAHLTDYGMHGNTLLYSDVMYSEEGARNESLTVTAKVSWLVCQESCIPGDAILTMTLPVVGMAVVERNVVETSADQKSGAGREGINQKNELLFQQASNKTPQKLAVMSNSAVLNSDHVDINIYAKSLIFNKAKTVDVYVKNTNLVHNGEPLKISWRANRLQWQSKLSEYFNIVPETIHTVLVLDGAKAYEVDIPITHPVP